MKTQIKDAAPLIFMVVSIVIEIIGFLVFTYGKDQKYCTYDYTKQFCGKSADYVNGYEDAETADIDQKMLKARIDEGIKKDIENGSLIIINSGSVLGHVH